MGCSLISLAIFMATATATRETTKVNVCSSTESYTLSPWLAYDGDDVTTTDVSYHLWNAYGKTWTEMSHWDDSKGCFIPNKTLADGSGLQCSYDGKLIVERSKGWPLGTYVRYWVQSALSNGSYDRHFYEVKFTHCLKTWIGASINLIDEIEKVLLDASKRVIEITFLDRNDTKFAVCNPERCLKLVNVSKTGSGPWLSWTSRLDDSGGKLELKRIEKSDNQRDIQVRIILSSLKSDIGSEKIDLPLRILVDSFQGSELSVTDKAYTLHLSTFWGFSQPSAENERTRTSPTWPTSSSARLPVKYCISAIILIVTVASFLN
ncbi:uncharacterized protein LOC141874063 [Acropora palmata]|uniref:uncharacterized protein LOC141874063 n=1 Tax=Acropora palmata TaxID=6131 RepID=UPI003DA06872